MRRLLIFAKAPVPGQVKTRLIPSLGASGAAGLHQRLSERTIEMATAASVAPVELWCAPEIQHPFFLACQSRYDVALLSQTGADLGERMSNAINFALASARYVVLIGTDCPELSPDYLYDAFTVLEQGRDCVLGPAADGGYVLIGLTRPQPQLFENISWGTNQVLEQTRMQLRRLALSWHELPIRRDVDRPEDLEWVETLGSVDTHAL